MIRAIEIKQPPKDKVIEVECSWCKSVLAAEQNDIWMEPVEGISVPIGRITCPICRRKFWFRMPDMLIKPIIANAKIVDRSVFNNAHQDMSKSGLQMLMDEKKKETTECL